MMRRLLRDQRGGSVVEFALTLPLFLTLLLGVIESGLLLWTQLGIQHGAEMAARCASVNPALCGTSDGVAAYAAAQSYGLNVPASAFTFSNAGCGYQVAANYSYGLITAPLVAAAFGTSAIDLRARSCFPK